MEKLTFDVPTSRMHAGDTTGGGTTGFISWARLSSLLQKIEGHPTESLTALVLDERGVSMRFKTRVAANG
jgi:hypothetical protein